MVQSDLASTLGVAPGTALAWFSKYWTPRVVDSILDQDNFWESTDPYSKGRDYLCDLCLCNLEKGVQSGHWSEKHWVTLCPECWQKYAVPHDLSFIEE
jgi:hypothetical protein